MPTICVKSLNYPYAIWSKRVLEQREIFYLVKFRHNLTFSQKLATLVKNIFVNGKMDILNGYRPQKNRCCYRRVFLFETQHQ